MGVRLATERSAGTNGSPTPPNGRHALSGSGELCKEELPAPQFSLLGATAEDRKRRWVALGFTPFFEAIVVAFMLWGLMEFPPASVTKMAKEEVLYFHPAAPPVKEPPRLLKRPVQPHIVQTPVLPKMRQEVVQKPAVAHLKVPEISKPRIELPVAPPVPVHHETFAAVKVHHQVPHRQIAVVHTGTFNSAKEIHQKKQMAMVHTGDFSPGSMAKATAHRPLNQVQTGGFGAANGVPNNPSADSHMKVAMLGSFDLPSGAGHGNGTGGAKGVRGTVAAAGFGNAVGEASGGQPNNAAPQRVQQSSFGNAVAGTNTAKKQAAAQAANFKPVVILSKPDPVYPPEARRLHIQGQVVLNVLFEASGKLRVLNVVHGLGHGMDGAAIRAAEGIRFKPAERNGRPMNSKAIIHIIFQLAN